MQEVFNHAEVVTSANDQLRATTTKAIDEFRNELREMTGRVPESGTKHRDTAPPVRPTLAASVGGASLDKNSLERVLSELKIELEEMTTAKFLAQNNRLIEQSKLIDQLRRDMVSLTGEAMRLQSTNAAERDRMITDMEDKYDSMKSKAELTVRG